MYKILFRGKAQKQINRLTPPHFKRVQDSIDGLADNPRPIGALKLQGSDSYRLRIGDYRVLYDIDDAAQIVTVYRVQHRREVYR